MKKAKGHLRYTTWRYKSFIAVLVLLTYTVPKVNLGILKKTYIPELKNKNGKLFSFRCYFFL